MSKERTYFSVSIQGCSNRSTGITVCVRQKRWADKPSYIVKSQQVVALSVAVATIRWELTL